MRVVIVVPCFNEEHRLDTKAFRNFHVERDRVEFCLVNDGSGDGTLRVLESLRDSDSSRFTVLTLEQNRGKAEAVRRGILAAAESNPDFVGFWDADLATPLSELPSFLEVFASHTEIEMVFGARVRLLGRDIRRRATRHYVGRVGATLISISLGLEIYDTQCGAKVFRMSDSIREIFAEEFLSKWIFDVEIIARFMHLRGRDVAARAIYEFPVTVWHDIHGSKVKSHDFIRSLRDLWKIHRAYRKNVSS